MNPVLTQQALKRLRAIHRLSRQVNAVGGKRHLEKLLLLARHHIDEIEMLTLQKNPHAVVETGDLVVLCLELLLENGADGDEIIQECFSRFERKLRSLLKTEP